MNPFVDGAAQLSRRAHVIGGGRGSARESIPANADRIVSPCVVQPLLQGPENCDTERSIAVLRYNGSEKPLAISTPAFEH